MRKRWCQWRTVVGKPRLFRWALQCRFHQFKKVPNFVFDKALSCLTLQMDNFFVYRRTAYVHTHMHEVPVPSHNSPNCDMGYRIFNVPTQTLSACVYIHVVFASIYSVGLHGCLFQPGRGGPLAPFLDILKQHCIFMNVLAGVATASWLRPNSHPGPETDCHTDTHGRGSGHPNGLPHADPRQQDCHGRHAAQGKSAHDETWRHAVLW